MKIAGFHKNSFVDYPGEIAAVVFTPGCNFDCYYCHNRSLLRTEAAHNLIPDKDVLSFLKGRISFLDAVVITGGEPTLQPDLIPFMGRLKAMGFKVKLDTNGTHPEVVENLVQQKLLDYIAMDIKAPFSKYKDICGNDQYLEAIEQSIDYLLNCGVDYEFRTTFSPRLTEEDILTIAERIKGAKLYVLQQIKNNREEIDGNGTGELEKPYRPEFIRAVAERIKGFTQLCWTRGL